MVGKAVCVKRLTGKTIRQLQDEGRMLPINHEEVTDPYILKRFYSPLPMCIGCEYYRYGLVKAGMAGREHDYRSYDYNDWKCYFSSKRGLVRNTGQNQYKPCPKEKRKEKGEKTKMIEDLLKALADIALAPEKEKLKKSMLDGMDQSARFLVGTLRLGEELNVFDSDTFSAILSRMAEKHFEETRGMNSKELLKYMNAISVEGK